MASEPHHESGIQAAAILSDTEIALRLLCMLTPRTSEESHSVPPVPVSADIHNNTNSTTNGTSNNNSQLSVSVLLGEELATKFKGKAKRSLM